MTAKELADKLRTMPQDADVRYIWDGEDRSAVCRVWLSRLGDVMLADEGDSVYDPLNRPENAPDVEYWDTSMITE